MKRCVLYLILLCCLLSCSDSDSFTVSPSNVLSFSADTVQMDTVFSTVGSSTYTFWVYNRGQSGIRLQQVRLRSGNQTGFRVNVDGAYLDNDLGSVATGLEVRKGDSLRVFVELTAPENGLLEPQLVEDNLVFSLESGVEQQVCLRSWVWDAAQYSHLVIHHDTLIESRKPIVIYGDLVVDSAVTLRMANTRLFFHDGAGLEVYGRLHTDNVLMRGDRLDHMFDYLPYDRVSGQWRGVRLHASSTGNELYRTEIRSATYGVVCDSAAFSTDVQRLYMQQCTVHNCKGPGLQAFNSYVGLYDCLFSNTLGDCVAIHGGAAVMLYCTLAQFYPFSAERGAALRFANYYEASDMPLYAMNCQNTLITGYADDVVMGEVRDSTVTFDYAFSHCLLRTPVVDDSLRFESVVWETPADSLQGKQHFLLIDEKNLYYDFHLDSLSTARGRAKAYADYGTDRDGRPRKALPDIGCYEYLERSE